MSALEALLPNDPKYPNHLQFDLTASEIESLAKNLIEASKKTLDEIAASKPDWNAMLRLADEDALFAVISSSCTFPSYVSPDKSVRDAATAANQAIEAYQIEKNFREDIYQLVKAYAKIHDRSKHTAEENRFVDKVLEFFERNGLGLEKSKKERLQEVKKEISELCIKFQQNLNEDTTALLFTKEELEGMSEDFLNSLTKEGDKYRVTLQYPHLFPVLKLAKNPETRKKMDLAKECQCREQNEPILERVVVLRQEEAKLLGFKNHAEYVLAVRMAKTPERVMSFLNDLNEKLTPGLKADLEEFLALKKTEMEKLGKPFDGAIHSYDYRYYYNQVLETKYKLNQEEIQQYFPLDHVTEEMLKIYQEVLGLTFKPTENPHVWHEEVKQYSVYDADTGNFMGHFYLDLHPREGKYGHAAEFDVQKGCVVNGKRQFSAAAMVANFTKSVGDKPALLKHDEVVTYFHEFGHVMHELMTTANFYIFAGTNVQRDFVETPSQMLENWCYEKDILQRLSKHYQTGSPLPENLRNQLVAAKKACAGMLYKRQLFFGHFDMALHTTDGPVNTAELWAKLRTEIAGIPAPPNSNGSANFGHLLGGYSAGYYSYLWAEVFSCDLFKVFQQNGVLDKATGRKYRDIILAQGGTRDALDLLKDFLGREPNQEAFLAHIGLQ